MHGLAVDGRGRVLIAWLDERYISADKPRTEGYLGMSLPFAMFHHTKATTSQEPDAELYFAIVENGMVGPNRKIGSGICPCCRVAVLAADAGNVYVGYRKVYTGAFRHVAVSSSGDGGATFGDPIQVSDDRWKLYACPVTGPALASSAGVLEVAWYSGGERSAKGVYACRMRPDGKGFSEPALLFEGSFKGSPEFAGSATIFGDQENVYKSGGTGTAPSPIVKGSMPASAVAGGKLYIAYTARSGDATSIRLTVK